MGIPFDKLIVATNENKVLAEVFESGVYTRKNLKLVKTKSNAMDILTASNFERLVSNLFGPKRAAELYQTLENEDQFILTEAELKLLRSQNVSVRDRHRYFFLYL